ncbi:MAG: HD domain-containing protein [Nitrospirota bacterium]
MMKAVSYVSSWIDNFKLAIQLFFFTSKRLNKILGLYDFITRAHVENVAGLARVAKEILGLGYSEGKLLELAAWLHDLGKSINYDYLSIIFTPRKLEYSDENLHKLMIEHAFQSENKLDELGYDLPVLLRLAIRNHHRFLVREGKYRDILVADPDYKDLSHEKQKKVIGLLDILMVIDSLSAYTEASRPSNWFDNVVFDKDKIIAMIKKRYGDVFKIDVEYLVRKILEHPAARKLLENNAEHNPSIIASTMKEWAEKESIYDVNYLDILKGQISAMNEGSDLTGFKKFLTHLTSPVFSVILWEKWAKEIFSEIITTTLENTFINAEIRKHLLTISREHPHSLFAGVININVPTA